MFEKYFRAREFMRMKRLSIIFAVCCLLFIVFLLWWSWATSPLCKTNCQPTIFVIKKGESVGSIAQRLEQEKFIPSSIAFQLLVAKEGITRKIQAGDFRINPQMAPLEIALILTHGTLDRWVTLIEGWRREEIGEKLVEAGLKKFNKEEFLKETESLEGRLFPDTYLLPKDADAKKIVEILTKNFTKKAYLPTQEVLIMASIIEREAKYKEDRPVVAGILLKRLKKGWALEADATVQYAVASAKCSASGGVNFGQRAKCEWWPKKLTREDLKIKSKYNTYLYSGLPPGPISNPGLAAIKAVLNPVETEFWFYLSDREGKMHYAKTAKEHEENIATYLYY